MARDQLEHAPGAAVQVVARDPVMVGQGVEIIGDAGQGGDHFVLRAGGVQLVLDVVLGKEQVALAARFQQALALAVEQPHMGPHDLVETEQVEIDVPGLHVDGPVRGIGHGIDADPGPGGMNLTGDGGDVVDVAGDVGDMGEGDQPRALGQQVS